MIARRFSAPVACARPMPEGVALDWSPGSPLQFTIASDHPSLPGHFPGNPVVPGVVVMDRVLDALEAEFSVPIGALRLPQIKFMQPLLPGQAASVSLEGTSPKWRFRVHHGERLIASGDIVLVLEAV